MHACAHAQVLTQLSEELWWVDGAVACVLASYIFVRWLQSGAQQIDLIIGRVADPTFLSLVCLI